MKKKLLILISAISVLVLAFVSGCASQTNIPKDEKIVLKIGTLPVEDTLPMAVAEAKGYFAEHNLKVELIPFQSAIEKESALQSGQLDGVITDLIVAAMLKDAGQDIKITSLTSGVTAKDGRFAILTMPDKKITSISDLKDKSIAISNNTMIEYITDGLLMEGNIKPEEVKKISIPKLPVRLEMLLNGQVDAIVMPDLLAAFAEFKGAKVVAEDINSTKNLSQVVLVMSNKKIKEKNKAIQDFYKGYSKAVADINKAPTDYQALFLEKAKVPAPIKDSYKVGTFINPTLPQEVEINNVLSWLKDKKLIKNTLSYKDLVEDGLF